MRGGTVQRRLRMLMVGCPGSGKGTLSARIEKHFGVHFITAGDLLRWHIRHGTELGKQASESIRAGRLMPDTTMMQLVAEKLHDMRETDWILDGFPRTEGQAQLLSEELYAAHCPLSLVVNLKVPESAILQRILQRWTHMPSGRVYNLSFNPPKTPGLDDLTGEPLETREDDNPDTFKKRIDAFHTQTEPMIQHFRALRSPYDESLPLLVDMAGSTSNEIWPKLHQLIRERFPDL